MSDSHRFLESYHRRVSATAAAAAFLDNAAANPAMLQFMPHRHPPFHFAGTALPPRPPAAPLGPPAAPLPKGEPGAILSPQHAIFSAATTAAASKKKGATFHQQPTVPPTKYLACREFYAYKGNDKRRIAAMMVGVTAQEHGLELKIEEEPFCAFKKEVRPTNLILQEELLRRAVRSNARMVPRPAQWEKDKIITTMMDQFPPALTADDIAFLTKEIKAMLECYWAKKEEIAGPIEKGWASLQSRLRLYHVLLEKRNDLAAALQEDDTFWREATDLMNDTGFQPCSIAMPDIHPDLAQSMALDFLFEQPVQVADLKQHFENARARLNTSAAQPPHLRYLMTLVQRKELDPVVLSTARLVPPGANDDQRPPAAAPGAAAPTPRNGSAAAVVDAEEDAEDEKRASVQTGQALTKPLARRESLDSAPLGGLPPSLNQQQQQQPTEIAITHSLTNPLSSTSVKVKGDEMAYLQASNLHLKQLELYNTVENEWLELEEKVRTTEGEMQDLNAGFLRRKRTTLKQLKKRMKETAVFADRCSKRLCLRGNI